MKKRSFFLSVLIFGFLTGGCVTAPPIPKKEEIPKFQVKKLKISPGQVSALSMEWDPNFGEPELSCGGHSVPYELSQGKLVAFVSASYSTKDTRIGCHLVWTNDLKRKIAEFRIIPHSYPTRRLKVAKKHVQLSQESIERWKKEKALQEKIYSSSEKKETFYEGLFERPLRSKLTSFFGSKRVFNNKKESWHSGTDFRAPIGTPIPTANSGKVVFAGELFFNGGTVIIDHGRDIFSMYCHLSETKVEEGDFVEKGEIIALSGNTGRSTGPHLHWGLKVNGNWVDGMQFIREQKSLKKRQTSILSHSQKNKHSDYFATSQ